uniref:Vam6/Vps39-like protein n=1 Tax=Cacopsylla melanoneura TaxID=428564 RepID=A0A8D8SG64_9HEMI
MYAAYVVTPIIKLNSIESIAASGENIFVGTRQGNLLIYNNSNDHPRLLCLNKTFDKKPVVQIAVVPDVDILISLCGNSSDGLIRIHDISNITRQPVVQILENTKGASMFCIDVQEHHSMTGGVMHTILMWVVVKNSIKTYYWKDRSFIKHENDIGLKDVPGSLAYCKDTLVLGFKLNDYLTLDLIDGKQKAHFPVGKNNEPCVTQVSESGVSLNKGFETIVMEIGIEDRKTGAIEKEQVFSMSAMTWSKPPVHLAYDEPYFIGLLSDQVQVRTLKPTLLIQNIPDISMAKHIIRVKPGFLFAASGSQIWALQASPRASQVSVLLEQRQFQLALILSNMSNETNEETARNIRHIKKLYARDLLNTKKFAEAMKIYAELETDPCEVIKLFSNTLSLITSPSTSHSHFSQFPPNHFQPDLEDGIPALIQYLVEVRRRINDNKAFKLAQREQLPQIIDTTLLKCYLHTNDAFVSPLLRLNNCHLEESEIILLEYEKYSDLIILYKYKGLHTKALDFLKKQAKQKGSPMFGHDNSIRYLQGLGKENMDIIFQYSTWILEDNPKEALQIFTEDVDEVEQLPRDRILDFLQRKFKHLVIPYLEHVINVWDDTNTLNHDTLIHEYQDKTQHSTGDSAIQIRSKLLLFLKQSNHYSPASVLARMPHDGLHDEKIIVLSKLNKHEQVLGIYVNTLGDVQKAIEYCDHVYQNNLQTKEELAANQVHFLLLRLLISTDSTPNKTPGGLESTAKSHLDVALDLMEGNPTKISALGALHLLPDDVPLSRVVPYLRHALNNSMYEKRKAQLMSSLLYADHLQHQEQRILEQSQWVLITENDVCLVCKKRFGHSAFVRHPNGDVIHYTCQEKYVKYKLNTSSFQRRRL